jgi:hypothetical protein
MHGVERQLLAVGGFGVERGHTTALPAEDHFELCHRRAVLGGAGRCDLAATVRRVTEQSGTNYRRKNVDLSALVFAISDRFFRTVSARPSTLTRRLSVVMSALPPKADVCGATRDVCFGPKADIRRLWSAVQISRRERC